MMDRSLRSAPNSWENIDASEYSHRRRSSSLRPWAAANRSKTPARDASGHLVGQRHVLAPQRRVDRFGRPAVVVVQDRVVVVGLRRRDAVVLDDVADRVAPDPVDPGRPPAPPVCRRRCWRSRCALRPGRGPPASRRCGTPGPAVRRPRPAPAAPAPTMTIRSPAAAGGPSAGGSVAGAWVAGASLPSPQAASRGAAAAIPAAPSPPMMNRRRPTDAAVKPGTLTELAATIAMLELRRGQLAWLGGYGGAGACGGCSGIGSVLHGFRECVHFAASSAGVRGCFRELAAFCAVCVRFAASSAGVRRRLRGLARRSPTVRRPRRSPAR